MPEEAKSRHFYSIITFLFTIPAILALIAVLFLGFDGVVLFSLYIPLVIFILVCGSLTGLITGIIALIKFGHVRDSWILNWVILDGLVLVPAALICYAIFTGNIGAMH